MIKENMKSMRSTSDGKETPMKKETAVNKAEGLTFSYSAFKEELVTREAKNDCRRKIAYGIECPLPGPDEGMTAYEVADAVLQAIGVGGSPGSQPQPHAFGAGCSESTRACVAASVQLLWDWFPRRDLVCKSLFTLLDMDDFSMKPGHSSPLDLLFGQIETGRHWKNVSEGSKGEGNTPMYRVMKSRTPSDGWDYVPTDMCRRDGVQPAEHTRPDGRCGMAPEEDAALGLYCRCKDLAMEDPLQTRAEIVQVRNALARAFGEEVIEPELAVREYLRTKENIMDFQARQSAGIKPEINAFERLYVASLKLAIEAANTSDSARAAYRQMLESELTELASANGREA